MSSHIDRYEHGERSLLVFTSTVMNMSNGRCETTFSRIFPNFSRVLPNSLNAFAQLFAHFYSKQTLLQHNNAIGLMVYRPLYSQAILLQ